MHHRYLLFTVVYKWFCTRKHPLRYADVSKRKLKTKQNWRTFMRVFCHIFCCKFSIIFFTMSCNNSLLIFQQACTKITQSLFHVDKYYILKLWKKLGILKNKAHLNCKALYIKSMTRQKKIWYFKRGLIISECVRILVRYGRSRLLCVQNSCPQNGTFHCVSSNFCFGGLWGFNSSGLK